jgi:hypothetical protein
MCHHPSFPFWHFCCFLVCCVQLLVFHFDIFAISFVSLLVLYLPFEVQAGAHLQFIVVFFVFLLVLPFEVVKVPIPSSLSWFSSSCWYYLLKYKWVPTPSSFLLMFHCPLDCNVLLEFLMVSLWLQVLTGGCSCASANYVILLLVSTKWWSWWWSSLWCSKL